MKTKLAIWGAVLLAGIIIAARFIFDSRKGIQAGLDAANDSISKSQEKIKAIKKKGDEERKKIRGSSEKDSVHNLNSIDRD